jgi:hypothetical protein
VAAPAIGLRQRWTPPPAAAVDWSHPLAAGLCTIWWPGVRNDTVDGALWTENVATEAAGAFGRARSIASAQKITRASDPMPLGTGSMMVVSRLTAAPTANGSLVGGPSNGTTKWYALCPYGSAGIFFDIRENVAGRINYNPAISYLVYHVFLFTNGPIGGQSIWVDGVRGANDATAAPDRSGLEASFGMGAAGGLTQSNTTEFAIVAGWKRELFRHDAAALAADPFCMLRR